VASGSIADTSALGDDAPNSKYFTPSSVWPAFKVYTAEPGDGDNAYVEIITSSGPSNTDPIVSDIPDQTINEGESFTVINLDDYVSDAEDSDDLITWSYLGNSDLTIDITDRVATITYLVDWTGSETITFTAEDTGGLTDSDDATFTVNPAPVGITLVQDNSFAHDYNSPDYGISVSLDSAATAGNLLVSGVAIDKASGTITIPSGFTLVEKGEGGVSSGAMAYKVATGGETTISWSWTENQEGSVWVGGYSGLVTSDVLDVSAENESFMADGDTTNSISTGTTAATGQADELAVALFASDSGNSVGTSRSWSNGFSIIDEVTTTSGSPFLNVASKTLDVIGVVESTLSHDGSDESYAMVATFKASTL
jgi:hypothetical protein